MVLYEAKVDSMVTMQYNSIREDYEGPAREKLQLKRVEQVIQKDEMMEKVKVQFLGGSM